MKTVLLTLSLSLAATLSLAADNWPEFRGPHGDGQTDATGLPLTWSETENIRWKTPIHDKGWSSPVVWGDQIWLTTALASGHKLFALCVDRKSGKIIHDLTLFELEKPPFCIEFNSYASPTPAIESGRVYIHFGSNGTACLDTATGKTVWSRQDLLCDHFRGPGSSPIIFENLLIMTYDGFDYQYVVAVDKHNGKTVWKKDRSVNYKTDNGDLKKAYSTPAIFQIDGRPQLISPAAVGTVAYDARTGEEIWKVHHGGMNAAARPLFGHGQVYIAPGYGGWKLFAVRPNGTGDVSESHVTWKFTKDTPTRPSQLLIGDWIYMVSDKGVATCLDSKTGDMVWVQRVGGDFTASPLHAEGRIYLFSENGSTTVIKAARQYEVLATNTLDAGFMASPAVTGKSLILRTRTHLYCVEQGAK